MTQTVETRDPRMASRILNLALRCNCTYSEVRVVERDGTYAGTYTFAGEPEALRRLSSQLARALNDDAQW